MNRSKALILLLFLIASGYALLTSMTTKIDAENNICGNAVSRFVASWGAGCYYAAYFDEGNSIDNKRLVFEQEKLEIFANRGGFSPEILWYRLKFHQKYRNYFRTNFRGLHFMYEDYLSSQHILLDRQTEYYYYLESNDLIPLAQQTLNNFCDTYILIKRESRIEEVRNRLKHKGSSLSLEHCDTGPH